MECEQEKKLLSKFKIPKLDNPAVNQEAGGSYSSPENMVISKMVFCHVCNKGFENVKAVGGHMRIHSQSTKKHQQLSSRDRPIFKNHRNQSRSGSENSMLVRPVSCYVCFKKFSGMRSLFGHMRCHPERRWRGIRPPPQMNSSSFSEDDDEGDMVVDYSLQVPKWSVKAKRGKKGVKSDLSEVTAGSYEDLNEFDEEEMMLRNAVNDLMLLRHMDGSDSSGLSTLGAVAQKICDGADEQNHEEVTNGNSWTVNSKGDELDQRRFVGNGSEEVGKVDDYPVMRKMTSEDGGSITDHVMIDYIGSGGQEGNVVENHDVAEVGFDGMNTELVLGSIDGNKHFDGVGNKDNYGKMVMGTSKTKKMRMMMELNQEKPVAAVGGSVQAGALIASDKYKCSTCNKSFSSHRALGGHRSSHYKFKITVINGTDGATNKKPSSVSGFAVPDQSLVKNEEFNQSHQQQQQLNRGEGCATNRISIDVVGGSSKADHVSSTVHQCSVCYKIFPSGQALGGHKRCHWAAPADGPTEAQAQPQTEAQPQAQLAVRSAGEEASTQAGGRQFRLMGFDLNVPASMVDDAQVGGAVW